MDRSAQKPQTETSCETQKSKRCTRCVNDASVPGIFFDGATGLCAYCAEYDRWASALNDWGRLGELWSARVSMHKSRTKGDYDALLGISGGKDSTYVLHRLVNDYGLRVKTFTVLNGFLTDWAKQRIAFVIDAMGVDHEFIEIPQAVLSPLYAMSVRTTGAPCTACSLATYAITIKKASEEGIPMAVHGRSRPQMFRYFSEKGPDFFSPFIIGGLKEPNMENLVGTYTATLSSISASLPPRMMGGLGSFLPNLEKDPAPQNGNRTLAEFVPFFLYHDYDELKIVSELERDIGWERPSDYGILQHHDCAAHDAAMYLYQIAEGRPHVLAELSVMVRTGQISRENALGHLEGELWDKPPSESLHELADYVGMDEEELVETANRLAAKRLQSRGWAPSP